MKSRFKGPVHGVPIPPEPGEVGNGDRPEGGVPEQIIQGVPRRLNF